MCNLLTVEIRVELLAFYTNLSKYIKDIGKLCQCNLSNEVKANVFTTDSC